MIVLAVLYFLNPSNTLSQNFLGVTLCNNTKSLFNFGSITNSITYFLLTGDTTTLTFIKFSNQSNHQTKDLLKLSHKFDSIFKKNKVSKLPQTLFRKVNLNNSLWHEVNYFHIDNKTKKTVQVMQLVILFEGIDVEKEKNDPKIKEIHIRIGKQLIDRSKFLVNLKFQKAPPPIE